MGFPGPFHAIAERAMPMKVAMALLAIGAVGIGLIQIPRVDFVIDDFLAPAFAGSPGATSGGTDTTLLIISLIIGTTLGLLGIAIAYQVFGAPPGRPLSCVSACGRCTSFSFHKWYFDELIGGASFPDGLVERFAWGPRTVVVQGRLVDGPGRRACRSAAVRGYPERPRALLRRPARARPDRQSGSFSCCSADDAARFRS